VTRTPSDQPARDRIRTDLATNMLVEAGAGSGKTTSLVDRMLEHVRTGTPV
jgi:ATP-dependent helicase/nuclease subunit A